MSDLLELVSDRLRVEIDVERGADILSLTHRLTGVDLLFSTPWRSRADAVRAGQPSAFVGDSRAAWLEAYRGGWQTLSPNAGVTRSIGDAPSGFHGELSTVPWSVVDTTDASARLRVDLFSVPIAVERILTVDGGALQIVDTVSNLSAVPIELDWVSHPAFGGNFLRGRCTIDTGARRFVSDPDSHDTFTAPGSSHEWPFAKGKDGRVVDLREVPTVGESRVAFGWLEDFSSSWAAISNHDLGLTARLSWDGDRLPYAWLWQELEGSADFPWFRRARVIAIEPSSAQTGGAGRRSALRLEGHGSVRIPLSIVVDHEGDL